jgi:hypothetical protein
MDGADHMTRAIVRIALYLAIAGATYAACDRHADASECAQSPAVARAEATLVDVQARLWEMQLDPPSKEPSRQALRDVLTAAAEEYRTAVAVCTPDAPASSAQPFDNSEPWETDPPAAVAAEPDPAWCAVAGCDATVDSVLGIGATP